jgi:hypothetical protein
MRGLSHAVACFLMGISAPAQLVWSTPIAELRRARGTAVEWIWVHDRLMTDEILLFCDPPPSPPRPTYSCLSLGLERGARLCVYCSSRARPGLRDHREDYKSAARWLDVYISSLILPAARSSPCLCFFVF